MNAVMHLGISNVRIYAIHAGKRKNICYRRRNGNRKNRRICLPEHHSLTIQIKNMHRGKFYYKASKQVYSEVSCAMLVFGKREMSDFSDKTKKVQTYVFMGALEPGLEPFIMYLRGSGIGSAKQFLGDVVNSKKPMF